MGNQGAVEKSHLGWDLGGKVQNLPLLLMPWVALGSLCYPVGVKEGCTCLSVLMFYGESKVSKLQPGTHRARVTAERILPPASRHPGLVRWQSALLGVESMVLTCLSTQLFVRTCLQSAE